jgi:hypothetical protein
MALTTAVTGRNVVGAQRMNVVTVTFDNSYPTGGEAFSAVDAGLLRIDAIVPTQCPGQWIEYSSGNLVLYDAAGAEETDASDQSGVSATLLVFGE